MNSFTEMITAAYEAEKAEAEKATTAHRLRTQAQIAEALEELGIAEYTQDGNLVKLDGLTIKAEFEYGHIEFQIQGKCPECNETCWSGTVSDLAGIGKMYFDFDPQYAHRCPQSQKPLTTQEALVEAIVAIVNEVIEE